MCPATDAPQGDVVANGLGDGAVLGSGASGNIWLINCHGVDIKIMGFNKAWLYRPDQFRRLYVRLEFVV